MAKLLIEQVNEYNTLYEAVGEKKFLFIEGVFLQSEIKNRNGRVYPKQVMHKEVTRYIKESVNMGNAFGELDHPASPKVDPKNVSHLITSITEDGPNYIGKAKILETPMGLIAKSIIDGGGRLAVSSRGTGSVRSMNGAMQVQEDFRLSTAADIVINPSAPQAYVDAIMESPDWIYDNLSKEWVMQEVISEIHNTTPSKLDEAKALKLLEKWVSAFDTSKFL